tara:strand:+ start:813 stop:1622 length:810 start_codon:yes stop_codon:yes gene_type:complete
MQLVQRYLLNSNVLLTADVAGNITEYKALYSRRLNIYRGIDNKITFQVLNADQKPVSILNIYTPKFMMFDEKTRLVVEKDATIIETTTPSNVGMFTVNLTENELLNLQSQFLNYTVELKNDSSNERILTYSNSHFESKGTVYLDASEIPGPLKSYSVTSLSQESGGSAVFLSEAITAEPAINGNEALHTAAFYLNSADGDVTVQATLDSQISSSTNWSDVATISVDTTDTLRYVNFNGVFSYLRIKHTTDKADPDNDYDNDITKILVRN